MCEWRRGAPPPNIARAEEHTTRCSSASKALHRRVHSARDAASILKVRLLCAFSAIFQWRGGLQQETEGVAPRRWATAPARCVCASVALARPRGESEVLSTISNSRSMAPSGSCRCALRSTRHSLPFAPSEVCSNASATPLHASQIACSACDLELKELLAPTTPMPH